MPRFSFEEAQFGLEGELDELGLDAGESEQPAAAKPCGCRQCLGSRAGLSNEFEGVQFDDEAEFEDDEDEESSDPEFSGIDLEGEVRRQQPPPRRRSVSRRQPSRPARQGAPPRRPGVRPSRRPVRPGRPRVRPRRPRPSRPVGFAYPVSPPSRPPVAEPDGPPWTSDAEPVERASEFVRWVQSSLNQLMGLRLPVDGVAGPATRSAIRDFQQRHGLPVDGIVGPDTRQALQRARAGRNGGSNGGDDAAGADGDDLSGPEASSTEESSGEQEEGVFDTVRDVLAGTRIIDLTAQADKSRRKGRRDPKSVYALVLHQMACCFARKDPLKNYLRTNSHFVILSDGRILQLHPITELLWASHGFNKGSVAVEFAGNFPSTRGRWWKGETYGRNQVTPAQIEAGRYLVRHLIRTMGLTHILAHRQSSATRENDPGPDIWYHVGQWAIENHGLKDGGPGFKVGGGNSIPDLWRTWGRVKPQPELAEELDPESLEHARWLQQALNRTLGLRLRPNAAGGPAVRSALRTFQRRHGLPADGELSEEVEAMLVEAGAPPHRHPASHRRIVESSASRRAPMSDRYSSEGESSEDGPALESLSDLESGSPCGCPHPPPPPGLFSPPDRSGHRWYTPISGDNLWTLSKNIMVRLLAAHGVGRAPRSGEINDVSNAIRRDPCNEHLKGKMFLPRFAADRCKPRGRYYGSIHIPVKFE
jgi:peptidoglycan hydrolase-like protein with peptidoglycan-binding domain